jgi:hypothetical protein
MLRLVNEAVFLLLGALFIWLAITGHYMFDPRSPSWLAMAGVLIVYGLVTMRWRGGERTVARIRGGALILVGLLMLSSAYASWASVTRILIAAGATLAARGVIVIALILGGKVAR